MLKSHGFWFFILLIVCIAGPYLLGVRPRTRREWSYIAFTIAFLGWVLLMEPLGSR